MSYFTAKDVLVIMSLVELLSGFKEAIETIGGETYTT